MIMSAAITYALTPIGVVRSSLTQRDEAPMQGGEGAPDAWLDVTPNLVAGLDGLVVGQAIIVVTWLHQARRDVLKVHPRGDQNLPLRAYPNNPLCYNFVALQSHEKYPISVIRIGS